MSLLFTRRSVTPSGAAGGGGVPDFASPSFAGFWKTIGNNVPDDVDPDPGRTSNYAGASGFAAMCDAWGGGWILPSLGTYGTYGLGPVGGHTDYYGNPVIGFDLATELWSLHRSPYANPTWPDADGWWPDESPGATHTYQQICGIPESNKIFIAARQTDFSPSNWNSSPAIFTFGADTWFKGSDYGGSGVPTMSEGCAAYDASRTCVWLRGGDTGAAFARYNYVSDVWTQFSDQSSESRTMMCCDPVLDILIMVRTATSQLLYGIDCTTPNTLRTTLTESGRPSLSPSMGVVYSPRRAAFIVWADGEDVYEVKKGSGTWSVATWTWTLLTNGANTVAPSRNAQGTYSKLQLIAYGLREFVMCCNNTNEPVYVFEVP